MSERACPIREEYRYFLPTREGEIDVGPFDTREELEADLEARAPLRIEQRIVVETAWVPA